ncbi:MAG: CPBP family intramembrane metalloprotease [Clostridia bacterium]|nr:CPBP family intramembrane metalloprotease [Clostridia bacterium]
MKNKLYTTNISTEQDLGRAANTKPSLAQISVLYSLAVILLLYVGFRAQRYSVYSGLLITEFGLILIPSLALLFIYRYDVKSTLRLYKTRPLNLLLVFGIMLFALPIVGVLNLINLLVIDSIFGRVILPDIPAAGNSTELIRNILIIAGSAAICEEVMFRGIIQRGMERFGAVKAILISAFLFGLIHLDFQRFLGTFLLGALIGFIVYRSNSLYSGMFAHFCNNSFAVLGGYMGTKLNELFKSPGMDKAGGNIDDLFASFANMPQEQLIMLIITWSFIVLVCVSIISGLMIGFIRITSEKVQRVQKENIAIKKTGLFWLAPGLIFVFIMYIAEGLRLRNSASPLAETIMRIMGLR